MRRVGLLLVTAVLSFSSTLTFAQDGYFADWFKRVDKTQAEQPHWITPLATTTPRLEEEVRYDQLWQENAKGITTDNFDGGKGLELIPFEKVEVIFNVPPYIEHNNPADKDGWGDLAFLLKYRLLSANEERGNYILTAFLGWSLPTGQYSNGGLHAVITPTIAYGKGFHNFDLQGTFGIAFPVADTNIVGRNYLWNNTFQYRIFRKFWPEVELNSTFFQDGKNDGKKQNFATPGLVIGRLHLWKRVGFTVGGGYQIATTRFHTNNHNAILSIRFPF
ncbi:MAG TPA: hypothetical protein VNZ03_22410 [Terriglobales bacterium]|jgi:hypothetical protein|nr:hypothetical protein [Terriglobales bacterium]